MLTDELKPCPFCGAKAGLKSDGNVVKVGCFNPECGIRPKAMSTCGNTAIVKWNRRVNQQPATSN